MIQSELPHAVINLRGENTDKRNYRVSFAKIRNELGFQPRWTVQEGIRQVIEAFKLNPKTRVIATSNTCRMKTIR